MVTEPLPVGVAVVEDSVRGGFERYEISPGQITFYVGDAPPKPIRFDIYGSLAGHLMTLWLALPLPRRVLQVWMRVWGNQMLWYCRVVLGLGLRVHGLENLPKGGAVLASNHQSAWDTFVFYTLVDDAQYVLKKELMSIPFWGWYARKAEAISVDRSGGGAALKQMVRSCVDRVRKGRQVIIFPEGTRVLPGQRIAYFPGVYAIYRALPDGVPLVPVALDSGRFWSRRSFLKHAGTINLRFLEAIPPGLKRDEFLDRLEGCITAANDANDAGDAP